MILSSKSKSSRFFSNRKKFIIVTIDEDWTAEVMEEVARETGYHVFQVSEMKNIYIRD